MDNYHKPWPIQSFNIISGMISGKRVVYAKKLIDSAKRKTGLSNFGDDFAQEAFHRLVDAVNTEARLHPFGAFMIREKLRTQLENRLWAEHWFSRYPHILEQPVAPILLVSGLQRTGTTKMQRLASRQQGARALPSWEALYPAPLGAENETKKRRSMTDRNARAVRYISPVFNAIHPIAADQPEEDVLLMDLNFLSSSAEAIMHVPSFAAWLQQQGPGEAYVFEGKMLKLLQWRRSGDYWVLKSPHHLEYLAALNQHLPLRGSVWMHRSLERCVPSFMSMLYYSRAMFSDEVNQEEIMAHWIPKIGRMLDAGIAFQKEFPEKICAIEFENLMEEPTQVLSAIAQAFPGTLPEEPVIPTDTFKSNHHYTNADWVMDSRMWEDAFAAYQHYRNDQKRQV